MFDTRLKEARLGTGYNMKQFAELLDMPYRTYVKYERNEREPNSETLIKIADKLGVTVDYLLGRNSEQESISYSDQQLLEFGLKKLGISIGFYEEDAIMWLDFPDGTLEISEDDLKDLMQSSLDYLKFKLTELRQKRAKDFKKKEIPADSTDDDSGGESIRIAARKARPGAPLELKKNSNVKLEDLPDYEKKPKKPK